MTFYLNASFCITFLKPQIFCRQFYLFTHFDFSVVYWYLYVYCSIGYQNWRRMQSYSLLIGFTSAILDKSVFDYISCLEQNDCQISNKGSKFVDTLVKITRVRMQGYKRQIQQHRPLVMNIIKPINRKHYLLYITLESPPLDTWYNTRTSPSIILLINPEGY